MQKSLWTTSKKKNETYEEDLEVTKKPPQRSTIRVSKRPVDKEVGDTSPK